jgi:hypothetical protein
LDVLKTCRILQLKSLKNEIQRTSPKQGW